MTDTTDIARRVSMTANGDTYEIWLDANRYHYRTDGFAVLMLEGMNHSYPRRVQSAAIKAALKAIVELHGQLEAERQRAGTRIADLEKRLRYTEETLIGANDLLTTAEAEIAALKAKLANPVVLPAKLQWSDTDGVSDDEICAFNNAVTACSSAISQSGFTVKE